MKKLLIVYLVMLVLCLSGCGVRKNNTSQNTNKEEIQFTVNYLEEGVNDYEDEDAEREYKLEFSGEMHYLQYKKTRELLARRGILHQYRNDNISLAVDAQTGEIVYVIRSKKMDNNENKLTEKEIKERADDIASRYIDVEAFVREGGVDEYDAENRPYTYRYIYKRYHDDLILTGWIEVEVDIYGKEKAIVLHTVQNNETDKGLEMLDKNTITRMDELVIEKATEKTKGTIKDFRVNQREAVEVDGETRLLYFVDAYNDKGEYASFSWFFEVVW